MSALQISGLVGPVELSLGELADAPIDALVGDVGQPVAGQRASGVRFGWIIERVDAPQEARWVTVGSSDGFLASLPIEELDVAVVVDALDGQAVAAQHGGPLRLVIPGHRDACADVKHLASITFSDVPGGDTRPPLEERADCTGRSSAEGDR